MGKKPLTHRQVTRQKAMQSQRLTAASDALQPGLLIAHYGTTLIIENQAGEHFNCTHRQNLGALVTGDKIIWQQIDEATGVVVACQPRRSVIIRPDRHQTKPMVANVDKMIIVMALAPIPSETTLDRYLVLAETLGLTPIILMNKCDLAAADPLPLEYYQTLGYRCEKVSVKTCFGLDNLRMTLKDTTSVLVGQSGVGKSSLLQRLIPDAQVQIQAIAKQRSGRQTTSSTRLYHLPEGGHLIDSPGIHQFNLRHFTKNTIAMGFREFQPFLNQCKFRNCTHVNELGCALLAAVNAGKIAPSRLQNYHVITSDLP